MSLNNNTVRCFYIVPTNALVYEVSKKLKERFRRLNYRVVNLLSGYEEDIETNNYETSHV